MRLNVYILICIITLYLTLLLAQTGKTTETPYHLHIWFHCLSQAVQLRVNKQKIWRWSKYSKDLEDQAQCCRYHSQKKRT